MDLALLVKLLNGQTIFLSGALVAGAFTPVMLATMRIRQTYPGYRRWAIAEFAMTFVFLLEALRDLTGNFLPAVAGNLLTACAMLMLATGMERFTGQKTRDGWTYAVSASFYLLSLYFYFVRDDLRMRGILVSLYLSVMALYAAVPLLRHSPPGRRFGYRFAVSTLLFGALSGILRTGALLQIHEMQTPFTGRLSDGGYYLVDLLFVIGITFSFFLLTYERTLTDLRGSNSALMHEVEQRKKAEEELRLEVVERKNLEIQLKRLTKTDELTRVLNRRGLLEILHREAQRARRLNHPLSVVVIDLDNFKAINDTYGHAGGDRALAAFVETCLSNLRIIDRLGRLGGDEFAVILPETRLQTAMLVGEKLRAAIQETSVASGSNCFSLTVSIGVAEWCRDDENGSRAVAEADHALYIAKEAGRNCVRMTPQQPDPDRDLPS